MKHLKGILRLHFGVLLLILGGNLNAFANNEATADEQHLDSAITLSLLTCQPGQEAWSLYGHTAIHYINRDKNIDIAVNYGMFDFQKPHFVLRFIFGLTDYEMGIQPFDYFCAAYAYEERGIIEQQLNYLSPQDKQKIADAIEENYRPENREYRYNFFYDNCTTRARDMLLKPYRKGVDVDFKREPDGPTFRQLTHQYTEGHPWVAVGNDLLLGLKADLPTTVEEQQFLPFNLKEDFDRGVYVSNGAEIPLLSGEARTIVPMFDRKDAGGFPLTPTACAIILALVIILLTAVEYRRHKMFWGFDVLLLGAIGIGGLILTAMIFSQHPTVNLNLQILLLNPLALVCLWPVVRNERKHRVHWFWSAYALCLVLFFIGNLLQCYAEGTNILASSLLIRCLERIFCNRKK